MQSEKFPKLLSAEEVSALLGVSVGTLGVWRSTKQYPLRFIKVGWLVRYRESDVIEFIESRVRGTRSLPTKSRAAARKATLRNVAAGTGTRT
jgi:predicted DNA-binding transcriptional regulator AlpA